MTKKQKTRLIEALKIRWKQLETNFTGDKIAYRIHDGHHTRDVLTILAVLEGRDSADVLLANMPTEKDLI